MPAFDWYVGIDYSGASTPTASLTGLRVYVAAARVPAAEVRPPPGRLKYWTRRGVAQWLVERLREKCATLVGMDLSFSFPQAYFEAHQLAYDWPAFLEDFHRHWPTDGDNTSVDDVRTGRIGNGAARTGHARWRRLSERRAGAKSVFHFDVQGSVAKSTHAGVPWLRYIRERSRDRADFWPFDGWDVRPGRSVVAEVYPSMWRAAYPNQTLTADQQDALAVATWLQEVDADGSLERFLRPHLTDEERAVAAFEGWILGVT
jgi:hypothetical protein